MEDLKVLAYRCEVKEIEEFVRARLGFIRVEEEEHPRVGDFLQLGWDIIASDVLGGKDHFVFEPLEDPLFFFEPFHWSFHVELTSLFEDVDIIPIMVHPVLVKQVLVANVRGIYYTCLVLRVQFLNHCVHFR